MPAHTNRSAAIPGPVIRLGGHRRTTLTCRDEVLAAFEDLHRRTGLESFTVRQVVSQVLIAGSPYKKSAIAKTIQRMRGEDAAPLHPTLSGSTARTSVSGAVLKAESRLDVTTRPVIDFGCTASAFVGSPGRPVCSTGRHLPASVLSMPAIRARHGLLGGACPSLGVKIAELQNRRTELAEAIEGSALQPSHEQQIANIRQ